MKKIVVFILIILFTGVFWEVVFAQQNFMNIKVNNKIFKIVLEDNKTVKSLTQKLPITLEMSDLNNNEKYCYLNFTLPTDSKSVKNIKKGDVMLFGNSCLVIFYKSFTTSYSYTKIGHIENPADIETALGKKDIKIFLQIL
ncbi:MAG: hypothetical protein II417_03190 [Elusimicrobia bacterium]|nr:hypothetical protein [Elusimicrobiota bacterium]